MDMRGLAHFIQDIRKATGNKKEEEDRVEGELAKIRAKFIDTTSMTTYDRKKYVCKLMFISMLGYPIVFGHVEGLNLMADATPSAKLIGYLSLSVLLNEQKGLLTLATHTIYRDLISGVDLNRGLALTAVANTDSKDFAEVMHDGVYTILMNDGVDVHVRKKALLTMLRVYQCYPEMVDLASIIPKAAELIDAPQDGVSMCAVTFLNGCINKENERLFGGVPKKLIEVLSRIIIEKRTEPGYVYYGVPAPWLQAKVLRLLQYFPMPSDVELRDKIILVLRKVVKATDKVLKDAQTQQKQRGTQNRVSAMNAVLFEVVSLCIQWDVGSQLITECVSVISSFIADKREANLRYIGLTLLARLSFVDVPGFDFQSHYRQYQQQIIVALHDSDVSIRKKALDVLVAMCNPSTAADIIKELLSYLPIATNANFKTSLVLSIALLAEKYCEDFSAYVDVMLSVVCQAGDLCPPEISYRVVQVILSDATVQKRATNIVFYEMRSKKSHPEMLLRVAAFILGEFGYQIALNAESTPLAQFQLLYNQLAFTSVISQGIILSTFLKFYNVYDDVLVRDRITKTLASYKHSIHPELQQRATEYLRLIECGDGELLEKLLEALPPCGAPTTSILQEVKQFRGGEHDIWATKILQRGGSGEGIASGIFASASSAKEEQAPQPVKLDDVTSGGEARAHKAKETPDEMNQELDALIEISAPQSAEDIRAAYLARRGALASVLQTGGGVLHRNATLELNCVSTARYADGRLTVTIRDVGGVGACNVSLEVLRTDAGLLIQSRCQGGDRIPPGGSIKVEFAVRSLQPTVSTPSVQLRYAVPSSTDTVHSEVLSLPVASTRFCTPYAVKSEAEFQHLYRETRERSGIASCRKNIAGNSRVTRESANKLLDIIGCRTKTTESGMLIGIAAFASQPAEKVNFTPVVCELQSTMTQVQVSVYAEDPTLQASILDVVDLLLD